MAGALGEGEHGELVELASIEALGVLDAEDRARLASHLRTGCTTCLALLREGAETAAALAPLVLPAPAPAALRTRVLGSLGEPRLAPAPAARPRAFGALGWLGAAAGAVAFAGLALFALRSADSAEYERALRHETELALARADSLARAAEGERDRLIALVETVGAPAARAVALAGAEGVPAARGRAFVEPVGQRIVLLVYDLPPPPPGRTYQLWTIEGGKPASAGTFATSPAGLARHATATSASLGGAIVLAVTVEPEGGVPQPTGPIVMAQSQ